jgi:hypothetical protein
MRYKQSINHLIFTFPIRIGVSRLDINIEDVIVNGTKVEANADSVKV